MLNVDKLFLKLELIRSKPTVTIPEMADKLKVASRRMERYLKKMQDEKLIKRMGPTKRGIWKIL
jgi:ATP-dependent DNA helicase RecG